jgi:DNA-binding CsgD family transcriptional regulator
VRVFTQLAAGRLPCEEDAEFVAELVEAGFVKLDREHGNRPHVLNPETVARRVLEAELLEVETRAARLRALHTVADELSELYQRSQLLSAGGAEYIDDKDVVNARLEDVVGSAEGEILAAQPGGPRRPEQLEAVVSRDSAALDRGVAMRTLYRATVRDNPVTAEYARTMSTRTAGRAAEYRTLVGPFERCIIVDRRVAFISNHSVQNAPEHAAWQITDRAMVAYIAAEFEAKWDRADPWFGQAPGRKPGPWVDTVTGPGGVRTTRRQREIMRELVADRDQKAIAARLGIGLRTVAAEINELKALLGASSVMGLGFKWALSPDRLIDDSAPEDGDGLTATETAA